MSNDKTVDKSQLAKKPIWYLFLGANILILLACVITWILVLPNSGADLTLLYLPTLICNLVSMVLVGLFAYFEVKDFAPQIMHFQRKWLNWYIAAFAVYIAAVLFNVLFFLFCIGQLGPKCQTWHLAIYLSITGALTLVSIAFQRYARFRIDLDVYRRKHGQNQVELAEQKKQEKDEKKNPKNGSKNSPKSTEKNDQNSGQNKPKKSGASGGLLDQME